MNNKNLPNKIATITGLFLGAFVLSALAVDWTPPTALPPANNTLAPINVGASSQFKAGSLAVGKASVPTTGYNLEVSGNGLLGGLLVSGDARIIGKTVTDRLQIGSTDISKAGYVLTNKDGTGEAEWEPVGGDGDIALSEVAFFDIKVPRNGGVISLDTPRAFSFCAMSKLGPDFANSDRPKSFCKIERLNDGKWRISGEREDDPDNICGMVCFR